MAISASVIFCDDIRVEANGKPILIGVYPTNLVPGALPQAMSLSIWVRLRGVAPGAHMVHFTIGANGVTQFEGQAPLVVQESAPDAYLSLIALPVQLNDYGRITFSLSGLPEDETLHDELLVVPPPSA
jgi:hypothetical protein